MPINILLLKNLCGRHNKGAIAGLASTGWSFTYEYDVMAEKIFNRFFAYGDNIIGSAVYTEKINTYNQMQSRRILETYTLFGDPATALKVINTTTTTTITTIKILTMMVLPMIRITAQLSITPTRQMQIMTESVMFVITVPRFVIHSSLMQMGIV